MFMDWEEFVEAAKAISWVAYLGTADAAGRAHVSVVAPGFTPGIVWVATRPGSKKFRNLLENPSAGLHWPVLSGGPGELAAWGTAATHSSRESRDRVWEDSPFSFDLSQFFGEREQADVAFVEIRLGRARLLGPEFNRLEWNS
jgi:hypothetical protein